MTRFGIVAAAFAAAFLATLWLVGSLYRGRRVEGVRTPFREPSGWRELERVDSV